MRVDNSTGKGTSGMDKLSSKVHRVHMELGGKLLNSLRVKTQFLERLQSVVDASAHTQKDDVAESNGCYIGKRVIDWMSVFYITGYLLPT
jgi:hypothetical protein